MSISDKLRALVKADDRLGRFSFVFDNWYNASTVIDRVPLPAIICVLPFSGSIHRRNGRTANSEDMAIAFVDKVPHDATGDDEARTYNRMREAAERFCKLIDSSRDFAPLPDTIPYQVIYEQLSSIVSGVVLNVNLQETARC